MSRAQQGHLGAFDSFLQLLQFVARFVEFTMQLARQRPGLVQLVTELDAVEGAYQHAHDRRSDEA